MTTPFPLPNACRKRPSHLRCASTRSNRLSVCKANKLLLLIFFLSWWGCASFASAQETEPNSNSNANPARSVSESLPPAERAEALRSNAATLTSQKERYEERANVINQQKEKVDSQFENLRRLTSESVSTPEVGTILEEAYELTYRVLGDDYQGELKEIAELLDQQKAQVHLAKQREEERALEVPASGESTPPINKEVKQAQKALLEVRSELIAVLEPLKTTMLLTIETAREVREFTLSRLFWFRNEIPLWQVEAFSSQYYREIGADLKRWSQSFAEINFLALLESSWVRYVVVLLLAPLLAFAVLRLLKRVDRSNADALFYRVAFFLVRSLIPAFALLLLAYWLRTQFPSESPGLMVSELLRKFGRYLAIIVPLLVLLSPKESESLQFSVNAGVLRWAKKAILVLASSYLLLVAVPSIVTKYIASLDELALLLQFAFTFIVIGYFCVRALGRFQPYAKYLFAGKPSLRKNWGLIRSVLIILLFASVLLGLTGYRFASDTLLQAVYYTILFTILVSLFYETVRSWVLNLATRAKDRFTHFLNADAEEQDETAQKNDPHSVVIVDTLFFLLIIAAYAFIWNVDGVLGYALSQVELFSWKTGDTQVALTLLGIITALVVVVVGITIIKALPAVYELFVFPRLNLGEGVSYAVMSISRYVLLTIVLLIMLSFLNVDLSKIGWLVAALGVGLGFGLQEVVSNFVCGLILLIERPMRVGDIITIEGVSGVVTKINIRSTTVTDWNKLENVIPNKSFITQKLTNWSLSNKLSRIVIPIGVAYGTDPEFVKKVLLDVAKADDRVCTDPAPLALFLRHGDSSLDFELRAYVDDFSYRLHVEDSLVTEVNRAMVRENIEIPFPQRDLHIRSGNIKASEA